MDDIEENKTKLENEKYPGEFKVLKCDRRKLFDSNGRLKIPGGIK